MKVSKLMAEICDLAYHKFAHANHWNDCIQIGIFYSHKGVSGGDWQVDLVRPSKRQLEMGEIDEDKLHTAQLQETESRFFTVDVSLMEALYELRNKVIDATEW